MTAHEQFQFSTLLPWELQAIRLWSLGHINKTKPILELFPEPGSNFRLPVLVSVFGDSA